MVLNRLWWRWIDGIGAVAVAIAIAGVVVVVVVVKHLIFIIYILACLVLYIIVKFWSAKI